jgi:hypothetical protein
MRPQVAVAGLLVLGLVLASGLAWLLSGEEPPSDPSSMLPRSALLFSLTADDLPAQIRSLGRFPLYEALFDEATSRPLRRRLGWSRDTASPWKHLPPRGPSALGLYHKGWVLVQRKGAPAPAGIASRDEGAWTLLASDASLLARETGTTPGPERPIEAGMLRMQIDPSTLLEDVGATLVRSTLDRLLPAEADGTVRADGNELAERWSFSCPSTCLFDFLDPVNENGVAARGWSAVPDGAEAVVWLHLSPEKLRETRSTPENDDRGGALGQLDQIERFLGLPIREEMASALEGPVVAAAMGDSTDSVPRFLLAVDLASASTARDVLDRAAALGLLTGSVGVKQYRGARVVRWSLASWEPCAAVDGDVLLLAARPTDLEDALDQRRDRPQGGSSNPLRQELEGLRRGSWKAALRAGKAPLAWETLSGLDRPRRAAPSRVHAVLYRQDGLWVLEGGGDAPAIVADGVSPAIALALRGR